MSIIGLLIILSLQGAQLIGADFESTPNENEIEMPVRKKTKANDIDPLLDQADEAISSAPHMDSDTEMDSGPLHYTKRFCASGLLFPQFGDDRSLIEAMNKHCLILVITKNK